MYVDGEYRSVPYTYQQQSVCDPRDPLGYPFERRAGLTDEEADLERRAHLEHGRKVQRGEAHWYLPPGEETTYEPGVHSHHFRMNPIDDLEGISATRNGPLDLLTSQIQFEVPLGYCPYGTQPPLTVEEHEQRREENIRHQRMMYRYLPPEQLLEAFSLDSLGIHPDEQFRFLAAAATNPRIHQAFYEFHTVLRDFAHSSLDYITEHFLHTSPTYARALHLSFPEYSTDVDVDEPRPYTSRAEHMRRRRT